MKRFGTKRLCALLLALLLVGVLLPVGAAQAESYNLWVNGVQVTTENQGNVLGDASESVQFDNSSGENVLTLWFTRTDTAVNGTTVPITFTDNATGSGSAVSILYGNRVTEIEAMTIDGSMTFEAPLFSDANADGKVTSADAATVLRAVVGLATLSPRGRINADVDGDGVITAEDAALILQYVVAIIAAFPAE